MWSGGNREAEVLNDIFPWTLKFPMLMAGSGLESWVQRFKG